MKAFQNVTGNLRMFLEIRSCHFVVCEGKNSMSRPLAIAIGLGIPAFVVCDGDANECDDASRSQSHERDNGCLLRLCGLMLDPIPEEIYWSSRLVMWKTKILTEIRNELDADVWNEAEIEARSTADLRDGVAQKNPLVISATLERLWEKGIKSKHLERLCRSVLAHAKAADSIESAA
ncbi:MAG: hypothetical protein ABSB32_05135 [Thermodesulfobacteriota bacterium]|jgi:hypothetical protein